MDRLTAYKGKRVFVTGHTGFKGRWLCEWLRMLGAEVTGYSLPDSILQMGDAPIKEAEIVFHLAAQALVREGYRYPLLTYSTNVIGTANILAFSPKGARIVCVTSDKVYAKRIPSYQETEMVILGMPPPGFVETDRLGGVDPYSASKAAAELVIASYRDGFGLNVASARAGNCIGGGDMAQDRLIPDLIRAKAAGESLVVRNLNATRPWQHVLEPLYGYLLLGLSDIREPFNFGPVESRSVGEVLAAISDMDPDTAWMSDAPAIDKPESQTLALNSDKAARLLGWHPRWSFERVIEETMNGYAGKPMAQTIEEYLAS